MELVVFVVDEKDSHKIYDKKVGSYTIPIDGIYCFAGGMYPFKAGTVLESSDDGYLVINKTHKTHIKLTEWPINIFLKER